MQQARQRNNQTNKRKVPRSVSETFMGCMRNNQTNKRKVPRSVSETFMGCMRHSASAFHPCDCPLTYLCISVVGDLNFMLGLSRKQFINPELY